MLSDRSSRAVRATLLVSLAMASSAVAASSAMSAPILASGPGKTDASNPATQHRIRSLRTSFDPDTGAWTVKVTFAAPQSASTAARLGVALDLVGEKLPLHGFSVRTDPDDLAVDYAHTPPLTDPTPVPAAPTQVSFDATRTVLSFSTVDSVFVGKKPDYVHASLAPIEDPGEYSTADVVLGAKAPTPSVPASAKHLTVSERRLLTVPLTPLKTPAAQRIEVYSHDGHRVGFRTLAPKYSTRRSVAMRVTATSQKHLTRSYRTGRVAITTSLDNGSKATGERAIQIRRR